MSKISKISKIFDVNFARNISRGHKLKVALKKGPKGISLFAKKPIKKGMVIAYYKFKIYKSSHSGKKGDMYTVSIYSKTERYNPRVVGDVYEGSLEEPKHGIPFWAYFSNEPSGEQEENCYLDINTKSNYKNRTKIKPGDTMIYKLRAAENIKSGEEIVWCYGDSYGTRGYNTSCDQGYRF